ncbi:DUF4251 domain-containing protein [Ichthyenterobacterium sp. W332]|uniref:DUF4251 domain-containing protein n=1 Tax=Microcosmobacter mediterraneus TaxID=3075607 RepID=A0ABU2YL02_9FLAO|nr:DUF4251 domain-containing protein [Ichthyenterobacterium sp. W332]MDT0558847.1 DUF4251 domain-containing protein [Ichthyenterobacterium sp. W332]
MKIKIVFLLVLSLCLFSCASTKTSATAEQLRIFQSIIDGEPYIIESDFAFPQNTNAMMQLQNSGILNPSNRNMSRISLIGNPNQLTITGKEVSSQLPYFGEVQVPSRVNTNNGIVLQGSVENYDVKEGKGGSYIINFNAKSTNEGFKVTIQIYPNLRIAMLLNGSKRLPIRYTGKIKLLENSSNI